MTPSAQEIAEKAARQIAENTDAASKAANGPRFTFREYVDEQEAIILAAITAAVAAVEQEKAARDDLGPKTLDAKWLDPECWDGCQSLVYKRRLKEALELKEPDVSALDGQTQKALFLETLDMALDEIWFTYRFQGYGDLHCTMCAANLSHQDHSRDCYFHRLSKINEQVRASSPAAVKPETDAGETL